MNWLTTLFNGGDAIKAIGDVASDLLTNDNKREKQLEMMKAQQAFDLAEDTLITNTNIAQTEVNKVEAASSSFFVAGSRPAILWICALALLYQFFIYPLLCWIPMDTPPPAPLDYSMLYTLMTGMLGIAGMRSYDKLKGTDTKSLT